MFRWLTRNSNTTVVYMRTTRHTPVGYWEAVVHYDAWGVPYTNVKIGPSGSWGVKVLKPEGKTDDHIYGSEWKHKSGPEIDFTLQEKKKPKKGDW